MNPTDIEESMHAVEEAIENKNGSHTILMHDIIPETSTVPTTLAIDYPKSRSYHLQ
ncbi:hypothetical protein FBU30_007067 [Linnemannia zychae]|nr:hypothetical protein FBU30_007067 [Linnemannia zychae]